MTTIWWVEFSGKSEIYFTPIFYAVHIFSLFFCSWLEWLIWCGAIWLMKENEDFLFTEYSE